MPSCRFGDSYPAVLRIRLSAGCIGYPDDREQDVCLHHAMRVTPIGWVQGIHAYPAAEPWEVYPLSEIYDMESLEVVD